MKANSKNFTKLLSTSFLAVMMVSQLAAQETDQATDEPVEEGKIKTFVYPDYSNFEKLLYERGFLSAISLNRKVSKFSRKDLKFLKELVGYRPSKFRDQETEKLTLGVVDKMLTDSHVALQWLNHSLPEAGLAHLKEEELDTIISKLAKDKFLTPWQKLSVLEIAEGFSRDHFSGQGIVSRLLKDRKAFKEKYQNALKIADEDEQRESAVTADIKDLFSQVGTLGELKVTFTQADGTQVSRTYRLDKDGVTRTENGQEEELLNLLQPRF